MPGIVLKYLLGGLLLSIFSAAIAESAMHQNQLAESLPVEPARVFVPRKDITVRNVQDVRDILQAELKAAQERADPNRTDQNKPDH